MTLIQYLFETGPQGTALSNANSGSNGASMATGSTGIFDAGVAAHGAFGAKLTNGAGVNAYRLWPMSAPNTVWQFSGVITLPSSAPAANLTVGAGYNASGSNRVQLYVDSSMRLGIAGSGFSGPTALTSALTPGAQYRVTLQVEGGSTTTSVVTAKVYSESGGAWTTQVGSTYNSTTFNAGSDAVVGFAAGIISSPASSTSIGWDDLQVNDGAGGEIGDIVEALDTPVVTLGTTTDPTTVAGTDGSQVVTWPAVSGAVSYEAWIATTLSPAQGDFTLVAAGVTSPHTFTGLGAGPYAFGIKAKA